MPRKGRSFPRAKSDSFSDSGSGGIQPSIIDLPIVNSNLNRKTIFDTVDGIDTPLYGILVGGLHPQSILQMRRKWLNVIIEASWNREVTDDSDALTEPLLIDVFDFGLELLRILLFAMALSQLVKRSKLQGELMSLDSITEDHNSIEAVIGRARRVLSKIPMPDSIYWLHRMYFALVDMGITFPNGHQYERWFLTIPEEVATEPYSFVAPEHASLFGGSFELPSFFYNTKFQRQFARDVAQFETTYARTLGAFQNLKIEFQQWDLNKELPVVHLNKQVNSYEVTFHMNKPWQYPVSIAATPTITVWDSLNSVVNEGGDRGVIWLTDRLPLISRIMATYQDGLGYWNLFERTQFHDAEQEAHYLVTQSPNAGSPPLNIVELVAGVIIPDDRVDYTPGWVIRGLTPLNPPDTEYRGTKVGRRPTVHYAAARCGLPMMAGQTLFNPATGRFQIAHSERPADILLRNDVLPGIFRSTQGQYISDAERMLVNVLLQSFRSGNAPPGRGNRLEGPPDDPK